MTEVVLILGWFLIGIGFILTIMGSIMVNAMSTPDEVAIFLFRVGIAVIFAGMGIVILKEIGLVFAGIAVLVFTYNHASRAFKKLYPGFTGFDGISAVIDRWKKP